jgi:OOP family OmpA-OmpF porin
MSKYLSLLLMLFLAVCVSSCGTKYARPDRCCCDVPEVPKIVEPTPAPEPEPVVEIVPEPEPEPEPEPVKEIKQAIQEAVKEDKKEFTLDLEKLMKQSLFEFNSTKIAEDNYAGLNVVADFLKENENITVRVEGHTDSVGTKAYNQGLSERRANAVADYLIAKGVNVNQVSTKGYGFSKPVASNKTAAGRAKNRRTELKFKIQDVDVEEEQD